MKYILYLFILLNIQSSFSFSDHVDHNEKNNFIGFHQCAFLDTVSGESKIFDNLQKESNELLCKDKTFGQNVISQLKNNVPLLSKTVLFSALWEGVQDHFSKAMFLKKTFLLFLYSKILSL